MIFSNWQHLIDDSFIYTGQISIQNLNKYKFLGVTIDYYLTFWSYVNNVLFKVSKSASLQYRLLNCLPPKTRLSFYQSFNYQHLSYKFSDLGRSYECETVNFCSSLLQVFSKHVFYKACKLRRGFENDLLLSAV